uniref:Uncharacterized protein n=1 Tax=Branchiostoma floridae TaxID=7739 RepID=C3XXH4_BRAFL|eukprot:XP_002611424.1 hypothetical protein BRAFLDRAFT_63947 [Branchiostoma floridae]
MFSVPTTRRGKRRTLTTREAEPSEPHPPGATRSSVGRFLRLRRKIRRKMSVEKTRRKTLWKQGISEGLWPRGAYLVLPALQEVTEDVTERCVPTCLAVQVPVMAHLREDGQVCCWDDRWERRRQKYNLPPLYMEKVRRRLATRYGYRLREDSAQAPPQLELPPLPPSRRALSAVSSREDQDAVPAAQQVVAEDDGDKAEAEETVCTNPRPTDFTFPLRFLVTPGGADSIALPYGLRIPLLCRLLPPVVIPTPASRCHADYSVDRCHADSRDPLLCRPLLPVAMSTPVARCHMCRSLLSVAIQISAARCHADPIVYC